LARLAGWDGGSETSISLSEGVLLPQTVEIYPNYPNPFNSSTIIRFSIPRREHVTLQMFDVLGKEIVTLINEGLDAGEHSVVFDANGLASGLYFTQLSAGGMALTQKAILIR